jgi:hypothetical protein
VASYFFLSARHSRLFVLQVAEMTGRRSRYVRDAKGSAKYLPRNSASISMDMVNIHEREAFQNGTKRIAIISEAASSGISLHADKRVVNQQPRVHFILELPWGSDKVTLHEFLPFSSLLLIICIIR